MSEQSILRTPQAVTGELDISPATLRRWADEFSDYLSTEADSGAGRSHRRYTDQDVEILGTVKELMNDGMTYEQVRQQLAFQVSPSTGGSIAAEYMIGTSADSGVDDFESVTDSVEDDSIDQAEEMALIASNGNESAAIAFLTNTLATLSDTQQSILNSQAANRELLGVLIQDNFNLKEENNRLRERILDVERSLAQARQEDEWRREALRQELDSKIQTTQKIAADALNTAHSVETPEIKAIKGKSGCLGALLGGSDTQIVAMPRRRKREGQESQPAGGTLAGPPQPAPPPHYKPEAAQPAPAYPRPTAPPE
ncbi:MAG: hypothetical protein AMJ56_12675 [Anaerolineae bacterium SG8_19]|nr:MAG: hypothetical protein AMJ56_12675 [Anaerolineae bacterium SG8_19]